jgi:S-formylglutathione hydrolase
MTTTIGTAQDEVYRGTVERIKVHGKGLVGNLEGDSPDRDVVVYLPPSYRATGDKRFPVVYLLHGFTDDIDHWWGVKQHFINVPTVLDKTLAAGVSEMIVVMPNAFTRYQGSMYSNSVTTGNWKDYVAKELVGYIDAHYRTIATTAARGLAGHSMGGYGAIRIGMKHPEIYSSVYLMSPCCLAAGGQAPNPKAEAIQDPAAVAAADFGTKAALASAAAWSPNPKNPPLYLDLPYKNGEMQPQIVAKWQANAPLSMIDQYISNLRQFKAIGMDAGTKDRNIAGTVDTLHKILTDYGIAHAYELYDGDHVNRIAERLEKNVMPFFSRTLKKPGNQGDHDTDQDVRHHREIEAAMLAFNVNIAGKAPQPNADPFSEHDE